MDEKNSKEPAPGSRPRLLTQKPRRPSAKPSSYPSSNASNFQGSSQERSGTWRWPWSSLLPSSATRSPKFSTQQPTFLYRIRGTVGLLLAANLAMGGYLFVRFQQPRYLKTVQEVEGEATEAKADVQEPGGETLEQRQARPENVKFTVSGSAGGASAQTIREEKVEKVKETEAEETTSVPGAALLLPPVESSSSSSSSAPIVNCSSSWPSVAEQKEVLRWILTEKRKVKPKDAEEKRQVEEDKKLLKEFLRQHEAAAPSFLKQERH
eukprot:TRINITY_DN8050_c0_g1_i1.p1 TRINITY_DN8050_c0_g1~~TRINITY_DN8050_c0_g1_i1.p1  ORF type:complete len:266 (+),score=66.78 TRINITY_DN8050_c0_g1_i1:105-902(+)